MRSYLGMARSDGRWEIALGEAQRVLAGQGAKSVRAYVGEARDRRQHRGFWLAPLAECRRPWEAHLGRAFEWPEDVATWAVEAVPKREDDDGLF